MKHFACNITALLATGKGNRSGAPNLWDTWGWPGPAGTTLGAWQWQQPAAPALALSPAAARQLSMPLDLMTQDRQCMTVLQIQLQHQPSPIKQHGDRLLSPVPEIIRWHSSFSFFLDMVQRAMDNSDLNFPSNKYNSCASLASCSTCFQLLPCLFGMCT